MKKEIVLSAIQKRIKKKGCPACKMGKLREVEDNEGIELYLWCDTCLCSVDSDGGYTD